MKITIKAARVNKDLTRGTAAEALGVTANALRNYENGITIPNIKVARAMAELYEVPLDDLIF